jgi:hypothetical protein
MWERHIAYLCAKLLKRGESGIAPFPNAGIHIVWKVFRRSTNYHTREAIMCRISVPIHRAVYASGIAWVMAGYHFQPKGGVIHRLAEHPNLIQR